MADYVNTEFNFELWTTREQFSEETINILKRERITSVVALLQMQEEDIKDLNLRIGERALFRGALKTLRQVAEGDGGKPKSVAPIRSRKPAPPVPLSPSYLEPRTLEPDYETIPYDTLKANSPAMSEVGGYDMVRGECQYANIGAEINLTGATGQNLHQKPKRRAPPPPPAGSPSLRHSPVPTDKSSRPPSAAYVTMNKVPPKLDDDPMGVLDEPTFQKEVKYNYLTRTDANRLLVKQRNLSAKFDIYDKASGDSELRVCINGCVPSMYKGLSYSVPVNIWLDPRHPYQAPVVFVTPSDDMTLNQGQYVDGSGLVNVTYLKRWNHPSSDLVGLVENLTEAFSKFSPVYAKLARR